MLQPLISENHHDTQENKLNSIANQASFVHIIIIQNYLHSH